MMQNWHEYNIGDVIKDDKRDLTIIDKKLVKRTLYYKYRCNVCGYACEDGYHGGKPVQGQWYKARDFDVLHKGCRCCNHRIVVPNINSIAVTNPDMAKYFINGEEWMYAITSNSSVDVRCPDCGNIKHNQTISTLIVYGFSCPVCSISRPIGERIVYTLLEYLGIEFIKEFQFDGSDKRYDFYIKNKNTIIEVNGRQHYDQEPWMWKSLKEQHENDKFKRELAESKGIENYIVIDASESNFDFIKHSIVCSEMYGIFDLSSVDWDCIKQSINKNGKIKEICEYWESHPDMTVVDMEKKFHYSESIIYRCLSIGYDAGWCHRRERKSPLIKPIRDINTGVYYRDCATASKHIEETIGEYVSQSTIRYKAKRGKDFEYVSRKEFNDAYNNGEACFGKPFNKVDAA